LDSYADRALEQCENLYDYADGLNDQRRAEYVYENLWFRSTRNQFLPQDDEGEEQARVDAIQVLV
jgi:hypothetical protein